MAQYSTSLRVDSKVILPNVERETERVQRTREKRRKREFHFQVALIESKLGIFSGVI